MRYLLPVFSLILFSCSNTIYVVRHAEKARVAPGASQMMVSDPPLSDSGQLRARQLKDELLNANIRSIFSTNYKRTLSTAEPLKQAIGSGRLQTYSPRMDSLDAFIEKLKAIKKGNVLVVGHSNTIDDIANRLCGKTVVPGDLKETDYDNLYEIKRKGNRYLFTGRTYGLPTE